MRATQLGALDDVALHSFSAGLTITQENQKKAIIRLADNRNPLNAVGDDRVVKGAELDRTCGRIDYSALDSIGFNLSANRIT